jgi:RNA polymerase sigma-70 factor (ECF subfamily)
VNSSFIDGLPEEYRAVLVLKDIEGLTNQEIADVTDLTLENVKIRLHRARQKLRETLNVGCDFHRDQEDELACELKIPSE